MVKVVSSAKSLVFILEARGKSFNINQKQQGPKSGRVFIYLQHITEIT